MSNEENTRYNNDENNTRGLANAVTAVTAVTNENTTESMDYKGIQICLITSIVFMKGEIPGLQKLH